MHCNVCIEDFPQKVILIVLDKGRNLFELKVGVPKFIFLQSAVSASKCFHLKNQTRILIDFEIGQ